MTHTLRLLAFTLLATACGTATTDEDTTKDPIPGDHTEGLTVVGTLEASGLKAQLLAPSALHEGLNHVAYLLLDTATGTPIDTATVTHQPVMHMTDMSHACPFTEPVAPATGHLWRADVVFTMASGMSGTWDLTLSAKRATDAAPIAFAFTNLTIAATGAKKVITQGMGDLATTWIFTLNFDATPAIGTNAYVLTAHRRPAMDAMMGAFPAAEDLTIVAAPEMPEMGHGSSGNTPPTLGTYGGYRGSVNLTMPGHWNVNFTVKQGTTTLGTLSYGIDL